MSPVRNQFPFLVNSQGKATRHSYVRSDVLELAQGESKPVLGVARVFKCDETGEERRYGFEEMDS